MKLVLTIALIVIIAFLPLILIMNGLFLHMNTTSRIL